MFDQAIPAIITLCVVAYFMYQKINKVTENIDKNIYVNQPKLYADFSAVIQEKIREIRLSIDTSSTSSNPIYVLNNENELSSSLELLSDMIRSLVFLETMGGKNQNSKNTETKLFETLNELDNFLKKKIVNGEVIADEVRDDLFNEYGKLQSTQE